MSTNVKLSKIQLCKTIQSGGFLGKTLGNMMGNLSKKVLLDLAVPLAKDVLPILAIKVTSSVLDKFERKISRQVAARKGKGFILFISNSFHFIHY